jgi:FtsH-binding integral membrane protein
MTNQWSQGSTPAYSATTSVDAGLRQFMQRVYNMMAAGVGLTGLVAWLTVQSGLYMTLKQSGLGTIVQFAPLAFILILSFRFEKMSLASVSAMFWLLCSVMGISMAYVLVAYTGESIARTFFIAASMFLASSLYGYTTKKDLTGFGSFIMMGAWGLFFASLVNIFLQSSSLQWVMSILGVVIFTGMAAWDTQNLKRMYYSFGSSESGAKMAVMGALNLYLTFINLFQFLLQFFGRRE